MNDLNIVTLTGEIASDIRTGTTKNNQPYAIFRLQQCRIGGNLRRQK